MSATWTTGAGGRLRARVPRWDGTAQRDAVLMTAGTLASGVLAYAFNVLAARSLGPGAYGAVGALWAGMFALAVILFRPVEQTVSRAVADRLARGQDGRRPAVAGGRLALLVGLAASAAVVACWAPITDRMFDGRTAFTVALLAGLAGYALSYLVRGMLGGVRWFGGYGLLLLADGGIRLALALPLLFIASPTVAAIAIAVAAVAGPVGPLVSRDRHRLAAVAAESRAAEPEPADRGELGRAARFAAPAAVVGGCEQVLVSGGPILVLAAGGPGATEAAGVLFAATLLVRAPVFLFQGVAAALLPSLTTYRAQGDHARVRRATAVVALVIAGFAAVLALAALVAGPSAMDLLYGTGFDAPRTDLALLAVGIGGFLAGGTFSQALLASGRAGRAAAAWLAAAVVFVVLELGLPGTAFERVSMAFAASSLLVAALTVASAWSRRP